MIYNQVLRHCGRTEGQGAVSTGETVVVVVPAVTGVVATATVDDAWQAVQIVETEVMKTVEVDELMARLVLPAEVWVRVTGQTVVEV